MPAVSNYDEVRKGLIATAADVFSEKGFANGTTEEIARRMGRTQPAIYHYVRSKEDLLLALAEDIDQRLNSVLQSAVESSPEPEEQLASLLKQFTREVTESPAAFAVFWEELGRLPEGFLGRVHADQTTFVREVARMVGELQAKGRIAAGNPKILAEAILAMPAWMHRWYREDRGQTHQEISSTFLALIGLGDSDERDGS